MGASSRLLPLLFLPILSRTNEAQSLLLGEIQQARFSDGDYPSHLGWQLRVFFSFDLTLHNGFYEGLGALSDVALEESLPIDISGRLCYSVFNWRQSAPLLSLCCKAFST